MLNIASITSKTIKLINKYFTENEQALVRSLIIDECGNNLPFCENCNPTDLERIHFAVIKLSDSDLNKLESAIELAKTDWRDLLVAAEFANDVNAHNI